jgi:hypothetical protein
MSTDTTPLRNSVDDQPSGTPDRERSRETGNGEPGLRSRAVKLFMVVALVVGSIVVLLPATARADARVSTKVPCVAYANAGATKYEGSGTEVITPNGDVVLSCHLALVYGTPVPQPTSTTYGNCDLLQLPSGQANLGCHYQL